MSASLLPLPPESAPYYPGERPIQVGGEDLIGYSGIMEAIEPYKNWLIYGALAVGGYFIYKKVLNPAAARMSAATIGRVTSGAERIGSKLRGGFRSTTKAGRSGAKQVIGTLGGFLFFDQISGTIEKFAPNLPPLAYSGGSVAALYFLTRLWDTETAKAAALGSAAKAVLKQFGKA